MSADNYFLVRRHPAGGYALVQGFASDVDESGDEHDPDVETRDPQYATVDDAFAAGLREYSEYGVSVHPECFENAAPQPGHHHPLCPQPECDYGETDGECMGYEDCHHGCQCRLLARADKRILDQVRTVVSSIQDADEPDGGPIVLITLGADNGSIYLNRDRVLTALDALQPPASP